MSSTIADLATRQLAAYNVADLEAFCACYHEDVVVLDSDGVETVRGLGAFRERYRTMFETMRFGATVSTRLALGIHCIDDETWWRVHPETEERSEGRVMVRYAERDGRIGLVQFLR